MYQLKQYVSQARTTDTKSFHGMKGCWGIRYSHRIKVSPYRIIINYKGKRQIWRVITDSNLASLILRQLALQSQHPAVIQYDIHNITYRVFLPTVFSLNLTVGVGIQTQTVRHSTGQLAQILFKNGNVMKDKNGNETAQELRRLKRHDNEMQRMIHDWLLD